MSKILPVNGKGLVEPPIYPCYKGEGLCQVRTEEAGTFECNKAAASCRYRKVIVKDKETHKGYVVE